MRSRALHLGGIAVAAGAWVVLAEEAAGAGLPGAGIVKDAIGGAMGWTFDGVTAGIARWVLDAVSHFVGGALDFLVTSADPDVEAAWFSGPESPYAAVRGIALVLLAAFVFLGLLQGMLHGDPAGMVRRVAGNLPFAVAGMVVTTSVAGHLVALTDALSDAVLAGTGDRAVHFLSGFGVAVNGATGGFAVVFLGLVAVVAAFLLWIELVVRASLVYLLVAISPIAFAATLWPAARGVLRKTIEVLVAVVASKFVICVALAIGVAALAGAGSASAPAPATDGAATSGGAPVGASLTTLLVGAVVLGLAAFSPFLVLKLIPVAEGAIVAHGVSRGPVRAVQSGASTYSSARSLTRLGGTGPSAASAGVASPAMRIGGTSRAPAPPPSLGQSAGAAAGPAGGEARSATNGHAATKADPRPTVPNHRQTNRKEPR